MEKVSLHSVIYTSRVSESRFCAQVASYYGWPVSTTHCIVGSMVGFGLVYGGTGAVFWSSLARVTSSWLLSPLVGALVSFLVYKFIRRVCLSPSLSKDQSRIMTESSKIC